MNQTLRKIPPSPRIGAIMAADTQFPLFPEVRFTLVSMKISSSIFIKIIPGVISFQLFVVICIGLTFPRINIDMLVPSRPERRYPNSLINRLILVNVEVNMMFQKHSV